MEGYLLGEGKGRMGGKVLGLRSIIGSYKIGTAVKNSIGNEEAKELICTTHGHELRGYCWRGGGHQVEVGKGGKLGQL